MILANMEEGYYEADLAGNFTFFNRSFQEIMGYPHLELLGMNYRRCAVNEESRKIVRDAHNRVYRTGKPIKSFTWEILRKEGTVRTIELSASLIRNGDSQPTGFRSVVRDITERMQTESSLRESEEKNRLIVENAREAIIVTQDLKLVFANPIAEEMIGYSQEALKSVPFTDFIHPDDRDLVAMNHIRRLAGKELPSVYAFRVVNQDGSIRWVEISAVVVPWQGRPATLNFLNDITERTRAEEALRRSESTLKSIFLASPIGIGLTSDRVINRPTTASVKCWATEGKNSSVKAPGFYTRRTRITNMSAGKNTPRLRKGEPEPSKPTGSGKTAPSWISCCDHRGWILPIPGPA